MAIENDPKPRKIKKSVPEADLEQGMRSQNVLAQNNHHQEQRLVRKERRQDIYCWSCCVFSIVLLLVIILVPLSIQKVNYNEFAFAKSRISGEVDLSFVMSQGTYHNGPDAILQVFPATQQLMLLRGLDAWTKAGNKDAGIAVSISASIQYKLDKDGLSSLFQQAGSENYDALFRSVSVDAIKNNATLFSADEYLTSIKHIKVRFQAAVGAALAANHAQLTNLDITRIVFPESYYQRKLQAGIQLQANLKESYRKEAQKVRGITNIEVEKINAEADAEVSLIRTLGLEESKVMDVDTNVAVREIEIQTDQNVTLIRTTAENTVKLIDIETKRNVDLINIDALDRVSQIDLLTDEKVQAKTLLTVKNVTLIDAEAKLITSVSQSRADEIQNQAKSDAMNLIRNAEYNGLQHVADAVQVSRKSDLLSLDYLLKLEDNPNHKYVNFNSLPDEKAFNV